MNKNVRLTPDIAHIKKASLFYVSMFTAAVFIFTIVITILMSFGVASSIAFWITLITSCSFILFSHVKFYYKFVYSHNIQTKPEANSDVEHAPSGFHAEFQGVGVVLIIETLRVLLQLLYEVRKNQATYGSTLELKMEEERLVKEIELSKQKLSAAINASEEGAN